MNIIKKILGYPERGDRFCGECAHYKVEVIWDDGDTYNECYHESNLETIYSYEVKKEERIRQASDINRYNDCINFEKSNIPKEKR